MPVNTNKKKIIIYSHFLSFKKKKIGIIDQRLEEKKGIRILGFWRCWNWRINEMINTPPFLEIYSLKKDKKFFFFFHKLISQLKSSFFSNWFQISLPQCYLIYWLISIYLIKIQSENETQTIDPSYCIHPYLKKKKKKLFWCLTFLKFRNYKTNYMFTSWIFILILPFTLSIILQFFIPGSIIFKFTIKYVYNHDNLNDRRDLKAALINKEAFGLSCF